MNILKTLNPTGDDRGVTMVEYGLLVAVIALIASSSVMMVGHETEETFDTITQSIDEAHSGSGSVNSAATDDASSDDGASDTTDEDETPDKEQEKQEELAQELEEAEKKAKKEAEEKAKKEAEEKAKEAEEKAEFEELGGTVEVSDVGSDKAKGNRWTASVAYTNEWGEAQLLTLEITFSSEKGKTTTETQEFVVPAGDSATFEYAHKKLKASKGKNNVDEVQITVLSISTVDHEGNPASFDVDGPVTTIEAPGN